LINVLNNGLPCRGSGNVGLLTAFRLRDITKIIS
jgi:hypothetical protein